MSSSLLSSCIVSIFHRANNHSNSAKHPCSAQRRLQRRRTLARALASTQHACVRAGHRRTHEHADRRPDPCIARHVSTMHNIRTVVCCARTLAHVGARAHAHLHLNGSTVLRLEFTAMRVCTCDRSTGRCLKNPGACCNVFLCMLVSLAHSTSAVSCRCGVH